GVVLNVPIDVPEINPPEEVDLTFKEEEVKMQVPDDLLFDFDDSTLKKEAMETLDDIIIELENLETDTPIHINGHTDNQGDPDYNLNLSEERAEAVWEYIQENGDIDTLNVHVEGFGETKPITSNDDSVGQERNRRLEDIINPQLSQLVIIRHSSSIKKRECLFHRHSKSFLRVMLRIFIRGAAYLSNILR